MPDGAGALGRLYRSLYRLSDGAMTPLIGGSLEQLGYDAGLFAPVPRDTGARPAVGRRPGLG